MWRPRAAHVLAALMTRRLSSGQPAASSDFGALLKSFMFLVHPDRFHQFPDAKKLNESSFQEMAGYLDDVKAIVAGRAHTSAARQQRQLAFFVRPRGDSSSEPDRLSRVALVLPSPEPGNAAQVVRQVRSAFVPLFVSAGVLGDPATDVECDTYFGMHSQARHGSSASSSPGEAGDASASGGARHPAAEFRAFPPDSLLGFLSPTVVDAARARLQSVKKIERSRDIVLASLAFNGVRVLWDGAQAHDTPEAQLEIAERLRQAANRAFGISASADADALTAAKRSSAAGAAGAQAVAHRLTVTLGSAGSEAGAVDVLGRLRLAPDERDADVWASAMRGVDATLVRQRQAERRARQHRLIELSLALRLKYVFTTPMLEVAPQFDEFCARLRAHAASAGFAASKLGSGRYVDVPVQVCDVPAAIIDELQGVLLVPLHASATEFVCSVEAQGGKVLRAIRRIADQTRECGRMLADVRRKLLLERILPVRGGDAVAGGDTPDALSIACCGRLLAGQHALMPITPGLRLQLCADAALSLDSHFGAIRIPWSARVG